MDQILEIRQAHRESTRSNKLSKARRLLQKRLGTEDSTPLESKIRRVRVDDLVADLLNWYRNQRKKPVYAIASQRKWETHLAKFFRGMPAALVSTDKLREY